MLTPPIATPAIVAGRIAGLSGQKQVFDVGWLACRLGIGLFIIPLVFIFDPTMLIGQAPLGKTLIAMAFATVGFVLMGCAFERYLIRFKLNPVMASAVGVVGLGVALLPIWVL